MAKRAGIYGARELQAAFRELGRSYTRPVHDAARKAMAPILRAAKANTPHRRVKRALVIRRDTKAPRAQPTFAVGGDRRSPARRIMHLLEFGVSPHAIGSGMHPGHAPQPFLSPAFTAHSQEAIKIFGAELGPAIERQAARLATRRASR